MFDEACQSDRLWGRLRRPPATQPQGSGEVKREREEGSEGGGGANSLYRLGPERRYEGVFDKHNVTVNIALPVMLCAGAGGANGGSERIRGAGHHFFPPTDHEKMGFYLKT